VTLDRIPRGTAARILAIEGSSAIALRLMEMGLVPGAPVRVVKTAPLGDPIHVCIRNSHLALRRADARTVWVELCE
jgi:ferrous iron transport protein A